MVAIHGNDVLAEGGELTTTAELIHTFTDRPPTLFVSVGAADFVAELDKVFSLYTPKTWQRRTTVNERDIVRPDGVKVAARITVAVHYFGWKGGNYHKIIDPVTMYGHGLDKIWPPEVNVSSQPLVRLLRWGIAVRDFCAENGLDVRPTIGGISAQFLTDRRFYRHPRRKVPAKVNERARTQLPGNYYRLDAEPSDKEFTAYYLDQQRAHHYHAKTIRFPSSDTLYAHGRFRDLAEPVFTEPWPDFYGLYCLDLVRTQPVQPFAWLDRAVARNSVFVFTNELQHLLDCGYRITGIRAAWGSRHCDEGLPRYAAWAEKQLDRYGDPAWLKPLLLSAYGVLATRPRYAETVFRLARSGEPVTIRTGRNKMPGLLVRGKRKLEPGIANVLHRGMIEAATRSESVGLAQYLVAQGHRVLSIYADAVIVEQDNDLPLPTLPEPWRCKQTLNHLQFIDQQAFRSGEMTKLPGVGREALRSLRPPRPRLTVNVAEEMERAEGMIG